MKSIWAFIAYIIAFFTHYTVVQVRKNCDLLEDGRWYMFTVEVKEDKYKRELLMNNPRFIRSKDKDQKGGNLIITPGNN